MALLGRYVHRNERYGRPSGEMPLNTMTSWHARCFHVTEWPSLHTQKKKKSCRTRLVDFCGAFFRLEVAKLTILFTSTAARDELCKQHDRCHVRFRESIWAHSQSRSCHLASTIPSRFLERQTIWQVITKHFQQTCVES